MRSHRMFYSLPTTQPYLYIHKNARTTYLLCNRMTLHIILFHCWHLFFPMNSFSDHLPYIVVVCCSVRWTAEWKMLWLEYCWLVEGSTFIMLLYINRKQNGVHICCVEIGYFMCIRWLSKFDEAGAESIIFPNLIPVIKFCIKIRTNLLIQNIIPFLVNNRELITHFMQLLP